MNKEERKAIEYYQDKEISFGVNFDTEKLLRTLGITEEDSFENHQIRFKTLLNLIEKLQKENEELKQEMEKRKWVHIKENGEVEPLFYISKDKIREKIKDKIEKYKNMLKTCNKVKDIDRIKAINERILELEELLGGRKENESN
jgi:translation initiation factor 2 beta subunit (eIF-2beta)/eIF-5